MEREVILVPLLHAEVSLLANIPHLWRSVVKAQVCRQPAVIAVTPLVNPTTSTGVFRSVPVTSPN